MARQQDNMRDDMADSGKSPLVSQAAAVAPGTQIPLGDPAAIEKLVGANLRLVGKIAHDFTGPGLALPDLVAAGNSGLLRAAPKFDPTRGAKVSRCAAGWIKQGRRRTLTEKGKTSRLPVGSMTQDSHEPPRVRGVPGDAQPRPVRPRNGRAPISRQRACAAGDGRICCPVTPRCSLPSPRAGLRPPAKCQRALRVVKNMGRTIHA